jgi:hypothetical protein
MKVKPLFVPVILIVALLGTVFVAQRAGLWSISGRTEVVADQQLAPADIKGWMTLQQVMDGLHMPQTALYALAGIPADVPPTTALKDVEGIVPGFEISTLRDALAANASAPAPDGAPLQSK